MILPEGSILPTGGTGRIVDAKMTHIFEALEMHSAEIEMAVDLHLVRMIYDWSCNYIHSGMVSYKWLIYFAHDLTAPLFTPHFLKRSTPNWDFGIVMRRSTLEALRNAVGKMRVKKAAFHINGPLVDHCAVGLVPDVKGVVRLPRDRSHVRDVAMHPVLIAVGLVLAIRKALQLRHVRADFQKLPHG